MHVRIGRRLRAGSGSPKNCSGFVPSIRGMGSSARATGPTRWLRHQRLRQSRSACFVCNGKKSALSLRAGRIGMELANARRLKRQAEALVARFVEQGGVERARFLAAEAVHLHAAIGGADADLEQWMRLQELRQPRKDQVARQRIRRVDAQRPRRPLLAGWSTVCSCSASAISSLQRPRN